MDTSGFYKWDGQMLFGPNFVEGPNFLLNREEKDIYQYPVFGWYWFDDEDSAYTFFDQERPV